MTRLAVRIWAYLIIFFLESIVGAKIIFKNKHINKKKGYYENDVRSAHFFLGEIFLSKRNIDQAIIHLKTSLKYAEKFNNQKLGYTIYSNFLLGKIYYERNEFFNSKLYFKNVIKLTKRKDDLNQKSKEYIKKI